MEDSIFGEVIYAYARKQALEDGVLVQVPPNLCLEAGFKLHTVITQRLHNTLESVERNGYASYVGVLWDILSCMRFHIKMLNNRADTIYFKVKIGGRVEDLYCVCGPDDNMVPCLTIMFQDED